MKFSVPDFSSAGAHIRVINGLKSQNQMSRRRKTLIVAGILLGVAVLVPVIHHYQLRFAVESYLAGLKAQGEPLDLAQVIPPPVPPEQNSAPLITNALSQIDLESNYTDSIILNNPPQAMNRTIPGKEMIGWHQPVIHGPIGNWPTNTWDDLDVQLAGRQKDLNDFRKLIQNPKFDFYYDYSDPKVYIPVLAPHLSQFKLAIQWLEASEFYSLHLGRTADACTDVRAMLAFVKGETEERFEISQLIRFAFAQTSASSTWDILQTTNVSDEDLAQLQQDWQSLEFIAPLRNAFLFERMTELQLQNSLRQSPTNLDAQIEWTKPETAYQYKRTENGTYVLDDERSFLRKMMDGISTKWDKFQWRWFWSYTDEIRGLQMWGVVIDESQMLGTNDSFQLVQSVVNTNFVRLGFNSVKDNPYAIISYNANNQIAAIRKAAIAEIARNVVVTAIALKRYELRHHQLPATLGELTPDLLRSVPIDYMDGKPLRYHPNADGTFLLYSVGENGVDDGGNPALEKGVASPNYSWQNPRALDWVWPQPATPEEVRYFYEHPPK
jgi:hypothetical protein